MSAQDEHSTVSALTGFSLNQVLGDLDLDLPSSEALQSRLGLSKSSALRADQIYNANFEDEDAVGADEGEDWEDEVNAEIMNEGNGDMDTSPAKAEMFSPRAEKASASKEKRTRVVKRLVPRPKSVYERYPDFAPDRVLYFTQLFKGYTARKSRIAKRPFFAETIYPRRRDVQRGYLQTIAGDTRRQVEHKRVEEVVASGSVDDDLQKALESLTTPNNVGLSLDDRSFDLVILSNWEDQVFSATEASYGSRKTIGSKVDLTRPINKALESGGWTQSIIWDKTTPYRDFTQLEFNHEDDIIPSSMQPSETYRPRKRLRTDAVQPKDKFNLSNDHYYESSKDGARARVRQTFGQLVIEHAYPARKFQLPFYKTRLSKQDARSYHRPALQFPANVELRFTKVRSAKKKKDKNGRKIGKGGDVSEAFKRSSDLSLRDTCNFVLWEYSEEHPPIIHNYGMCSMLVNYYRKREDQDEHVPKYDLGEPFVLEPQDESPFMKFGYVYSGQTVPALYNNLIRAPLFRHKAAPTDFLVMRSTTKGEAKYYIREIKNLFVIGQTYPVTEVPGPHSRKITTTVKNRLQIIAYKLLRKSPGERLKIIRLMKYFPDHNELQMRQRLKEFMEYHRRGPHQGFWRLRDGVTIPMDAEMLKMLSPESVVLSESMLVGQRHLQDSGYGQAADSVGEGEEHKLSIEQQLAPWITTKNFLHATQAKAMLKLHGEGDPSGRGEAFSFIRVSMKDIFVKAGENYEEKLAEVENRPKSAHRYNVAEQQTIYRSEIERIWNAQAVSLSKKTPPVLSDDEDDKMNGPSAPRRNEAEESPPANFPQHASPFNIPGISAAPHPQPPLPSHVSPSPSRASSQERDISLPPETGGSRVLRINRMVDGQWKMEIVRDPAVISSYLRRRRQLEDEGQEIDQLMPTGDPERDARARKRLEDAIARRKKNQERRLHRKNAKRVKDGEAPIALERSVKPETTRRCGHCGQMGHMKTNRKCPRWAEFNTVPGAATGSPAAGAMSPLGGTGLTSIGYNAAGNMYNSPAVSSPLATSPPIVNEAEEEPVSVSTPGASGSGSGTKIKLSLKRS